MPPPQSLPGSREICFLFDKDVPMSEAAGTLELARLATEALHGTARVQLEVHSAVDRAARVVTVDAATDVGHTLAVIFLGLSRREFGGASVRVRRATVAGQGRAAS
jgi:hypothetical protein